ncbi:hypothetical protein [Limosilactobacillus reuteri]|uniref:hypothetical protein n=1 Tax=Limosilactobacillus reuteri TaxID=1598 RepID=UPI0015C64279|nr:hypothetical protein [Limosilactobacillus reuteri]
MVSPVTIATDLLIAQSFLFPTFGFVPIRNSSFKNNYEDNKENFQERMTSLKDYTKS